MQKDNNNSIYQSSYQENNSSFSITQEKSKLKKTKSIYKNKKSLEQINCEKCKKNLKQKSNLGRPLKTDQKFDVPEDNTVSLKKIFITHFKRMGLHKGLVFKESTRKKLRQQQRKKKFNYQIQWKQKHYWKPTQEKQKIKDLIVMLEQKFNEDSLTKISKKLLDISEIISGECTSEIYKFLIQIILIMEQQRQNIQIIAQQGFDKYIFLTGRFTNCKVPFDIQIQSNQSKRISLLKKLYHCSINQMKKIIHELLNK